MNKAVVVAVVAVLGGAVAYMLIGKLNQLVCVHLPGNVRRLFDSGPLACMLLHAPIVVEAKMSAKQHIDWQRVCSAQRKQQRKEAYKAFHAVTTEKYDNVYRVLNGFK